MKTHNPENERIKREYFAFLSEAKGLSEASVDAAAKAIASFEAYTRGKHFRAFHKEQAVGFKRHFAEKIGQRSGEPLSKATLRQTFAALKAFLQWLAGRPGYRSQITYSDASYFNSSLKDVAIAKAVQNDRIPTIEQIHHVISIMPHGTDIERRNRALVAFIAVTGARVTAVASIQLRHVDLEAGRIMQDARQVRTKFSKSFPTFFFNVGGEALQIVAEWVGFLRHERGWGHDDPLFPATRIALDSEGKFESAGLDRQGWHNSTPIRTIFRDAFGLADLPYYNPHSFRKTLALLAGRTCRTPEQFKAWSQNLGHDDVLTTFRSYGSVSTERQGALIRDAKLATEDETDFAELFAVVDRLKQKVPG